LFCEKGYYATSIAEIARQAGILKGLLYHYFASREKVVGTLVDSQIEDILSRPGLNDLSSAVFGCDRDRLKSLRGGDLSDVV
jgi:AcrR family transcriptional regulator